jgi:hypothetical protein
MRILTSLTAALIVVITASVCSFPDQPGTSVAGSIVDRSITAPAAEDGARRSAQNPGAGAHRYAYFPPNRVDRIAATWDRSVPVTFLIARRQAQPRMLRTIMETFRRARVQTGIRFTYGGRTATSKPVGTADQPVVIVDFGTVNTHPRLAKYHGEVYAVGGPMFASEAGQEMFTGGQVTIDVNTTRPLERGFRTGRLGNTLLHEVGHVLGLSHVNAPRQLMAPGSIRANIRGWFHEGDLRGLRRLIHD